MMGALNRALAARGAAWRYGGPGTPGVIVSGAVPGVNGVPVARRDRLESVGRAPDSVVLATVNGTPWLVRDGDLLLLGSRLDTTWTDLPTRAAFLPFVDALVNRLIRGEAPVAWREGRPHVEFRLRGTDTVGATVYGLDQRESDLSPASPAEVASALGAVVLDAARFATARFAGGRRADATALLLILALIIATTELGVATLAR
jgi:hypothetical protein